MQSISALRTPIVDSIKGIDVVEEKVSDESTARTLGEFVVKAVGPRLAQIKGMRGASVAAPEWLGRKDNTDIQKNPAPAMPWSTEFIPGLVRHCGCHGAIAAALLATGDENAALRARESACEKPQSYNRHS